MAFLETEEEYKELVQERHQQLEDEFAKAKFYVEKLSDTHYKISPFPWAD